MDHDLVSLIHRHCKTFVYLYICVLYHYLVENGKNNGILSIANLPNANIAIVILVPFSHTTYMWFHIGTPIEQVMAKASPHRKVHTYF